jgi:hypothetical protein
MPDGLLAGTLLQPGAVDAVNFNPASTRLAIAAANELREWDAANLTVLRGLVRASNRITGTPFTPDSSKVVSASWDGKVSVTDVASGALLRQMQAGGAGASVFAVATSSDTVAAGINVPSVIKLFRLSDGALLQTLNPGPQTYTRSAAFSPDGATLATGHFGNVGRLWNVADGSLLHTLGTGAGSGDMNGIGFTSDGSRVVTASSDGFVRVWDTGGNLLRSMGPAGQALSAIAISPDNQFALAGGQLGLIQLWRIETGELVYGFVGSGNKDVTQLRFTPSGSAFYAGRSDNGSNPGTLRIYQTSDHALLASYNSESGVIGNNPTGPMVVDVSPDGKYLSYGREDATVVLAYNSLIAAPTSAVAVAGQISKGSFADLVVPDGKMFAARPTATSAVGSAPVQIDLSARLPLAGATRVSFQIVGSASVDGVQQEVWMRNAQTGILELVDSHPLTTVEQTIRVDFGANFARFVDKAGNLAARLKWSRPSVNGKRPESAPNDWLVTLDQTVWAAGL